MKAKAVKFRRFPLLILVVITMLVYTACGVPGSSSDSASYPNTGAVTDGYYENEVTEDSEFGETAEQLDDVTNSGRKLIKNVEMSVETKEYDKLNDAVYKKLSEVNGYVQNAESYGTNYNSTARRSNKIVVRVPSEKLDDFVTAVSGMGNVVRKSENVEDVTMTYVDIESRKKALLIEQDRLLALLEKADSLENIITLEQRLSDVRYQLESYEAQLRTYDNDVRYSTVTINVEEVEIITPAQPKNAWERMSTGFTTNLTKVGNGFIDLAVLFIAYLPFIVLIGVLVGGITFAIIKILKVTSKSAKVPSTGVSTNINSTNPPSSNVKLNPQAQQQVRTSVQSEQQMPQQHYYPMANNGTAKGQNVNSQNDNDNNNKQ